MLFFRNLESQSKGLVLVNAKKGLYKKKTIKSILRKTKNNCQYYVIWSERTYMHTAGRLSN